MANGAKAFTVAALMAIVAISASQGQASDTVFEDLPTVGADQH